MGDWLSIIFLVLVGLILIYLELVFVPGTTVLGLVGLVLCAIGIYMTYGRHGVAAGNWLLLGSTLVTIGALVYSFRSKSWDRFSLKTTNKGKVNEDYFTDLQIEMRGLATSDLKPFGKAEFENKTYEVKSRGEHIASGSQVKIIKIAGSRIIVEMLNTTN